VKKLILVLSGVALFVVMVIGFSILAEGQTEAISKTPLSKEQLEIIKQKIKSGEDFIRLEFDTKGSFSWWGYLTYPGQWHFHLCAEPLLQISSGGHWECLVI
jgi:hypothetical protein